MISFRVLLVIDGITMFISVTVGAITPTLFDIYSPETAGLVVGVLMGIVAVCNQLRARLSLPPPTQAMIASAVAAQVPAAVAAQVPAAAVAAAKEVAPAAAAEAAPAAAAAAAPAAAREAAPVAAAEAAKNPST